MIIYTTVLLYIHISIYIYIYTYLHMYSTYMNTFDVFFWEGKGGIHIHTKNKLNWWCRAESKSKKEVIHRSPAQKKMTCVSSGHSFGRWAESFVNQSTSHKAQENTCFGNARELQHHSSRLDQWIRQWGRCLPRIIDACMKILRWSLTCPENHAYTKENWNWKLTGVSRWVTVYSTAHVNVGTIHVYMYIDVYNYIQVFIRTKCIV